MEVRNGMYFGTNCHGVRICKDAILYSTKFRVVTEDIKTEIYRVLDKESESESESESEIKIFIWNDCCDVNANHVYMAWEKISKLELVDLLERNLLPL